MNEKLSVEELDELFELGQKYELGKFVDKDINKAIETYSRCAEQGYIPALTRLGWIYDEAGDKQKAFEFFIRAAEYDNSDAMVGLGNMYMNGEVPSSDIKSNDGFKTGVKWLQKAAILGNSRGVLNYAICLYHGRGTKRDYDMAFWLFLRAARMGENDALLYLGLCHQHGRGTNKSIRDAIGCYLTGAENGDSYCYSNLAKIYADGYEGHKPDYPKAAGYYLDALVRGDALGYAGIAHMYEVGTITGKKDVESAKKWFQLAEQHEYEDAHDELDRLGAKSHTYTIADEMKLRLKCLADIDNEISFDEHRQALEFFLNNAPDRCSQAGLSRGFKWGLGHRVAIIRDLEHIGALLPIDNEYGRLQLLMKDIKEFDKLLKEAK